MFMSPTDESIEEMINALIKTDQAMVSKGFTSDGKEYHLCVLTDEFYKKLSEVMIIDPRSTSVIEKVTEESDPVKFENGDWYFYEETWTNRHGPYETEAIAREHLKEYCEKYL